MREPLFFVQVKINTFVIQNVTLTNLTVYENVDILKIPKTS